jgi:nucleotide-binding universal stress UspA family protein
MEKRKSTMIKIERILCPTDLSTEADEALRYALALSKAYEAELILLYCRQTGSVADWVNGSRALDLFRLSLFTRLDADELKTLEWTGVVCEGDDVGVAISSEAQSRNADLIVMRSRRRPRAAVLLGSTAQTVCRIAPCPVLVTHPNEVEWVGLSTNEIDLHRVLIVHDFSPDSELALKYGSSLAQKYGAEVHLLHVLDSDGHQEPELAWSASSGGTAYTSVASNLQRSVLEAFLWSKIVNSVRYGKVYEEVLDYAKENEIDLICMGVIGSDLSLSKLFGSNVDRVLRQAPCPVLVVRPTKRSE